MNGQAFHVKLLTQAIIDTNGNVVHPRKISVWCIYNEQETLATTDCFYSLPEALRWLFKTIKYTACYCDYTDARCYKVKFTSEPLEGQGQ